MNCTENINKFLVSFYPRHKTTSTTTTNKTTTTKQNIYLHARRYACTHAHKHALIKERKQSETVFKNMRQKGRNRPSENPKTNKTNKIHINKNKIKINMRHTMLFAMLLPDTTDIRISIIFTRFFKSASCVQTLPSFFSESILHIVWRVDVHFVCETRRKQNKIKM